MFQISNIKSAHRNVVRAFTTCLLLSSLIPYHHVPPFLLPFAYSITLTPLAAHLILVEARHRVIRTPPILSTHLSFLSIMLLPRPPNPTLAVHSPSSTFHLITCSVTPNPVHNSTFLPFLSFLPSPYLSQAGFSHHATPPLHASSCSSLIPSLCTLCHSSALNKVVHIPSLGVRAKSY